MSCPGHNVIFVTLKERYGRDWTIFCDREAYSRLIKGVNANNKIYGPLDRSSLPRD